MNYMIAECESLYDINLSNFNTQNVKNMHCMFWIPIRKENIITKDKKILSLLKI